VRKEAEKSTDCRSSVGPIYRSILPAVGVSQVCRAYALRAHFRGPLQNDERVGSGTHFGARVVSRSRKASHRFLRSVSMSAIPTGGSVFVSGLWSYSSRGLHGLFGER